MNQNAPILKWNALKWESKNQRMYKHTEENVWPWFNEEVDPDILDVLRANNYLSGRVLDIGACSGLQAIGLAKLGYSVVGTEVSETALQAAVKNNAELPPAQRVEFFIDDIAESKISDDEFDIILDRGCFHSICCFAAREYVANIQRIMRPHGIALIKTMSSDETRFDSYDEIGGKKIPMPYRFKKAELVNIFGRRFGRCEIRKSAFFSKNVSPPASAWLTILTQ